MWPHFETWHGRLEGARGDTERWGERWVGKGMERMGFQTFSLLRSFMRAETSFSQPEHRPAATLERSREHSSVTPSPTTTTTTRSTFYTSCLPSLIYHSALSALKLLKFCTTCFISNKIHPHFVVHQLRLLSCVFLSAHRFLKTCI